GLGARVILVHIDNAMLRLRLRIKADEAGIGSHPVLAAARFQKVIYLTVGQSLIRAVVRECITVKARQSVTRAKPEESARVADNLVDIIVRQPVDSGVGLDGQSLGPRQARNRQQSQQQTRSAKYGCVWFATYDTHMFFSRAKMAVCFG